MTPLTTRGGDRTCGLLRHYRSIKSRLLPSIFLLFNFLPLKSYRATTPPSIHSFFGANQGKELPAKWAVWTGIVSAHADSSICSEKESTL